MSPLRDRIARGTAWTLVVLIGAPGMLLIHLHLFGLVYGALVPSQTVELKVPQVDAVLRLELYATSPIGKAESDRQLVVTTPAGSKSLALSNDWGGNHRLSFYLTPAKQIVVLGAADSHRIAINPVRFGRLGTESSDTWTYLGAFSRGNERLFTIRYYAPDEQPECIPTLTAEVPAVGPRAHAYQSRC